MEDYFEKNQNEREILINNVRKYQQRLNAFAVRLYEDIPDYLLPQKYRFQRQLVEESKGNRLIDVMVDGKRKVVTHTLNPEYQEGLRKRVEG